MVSQEQFPAAVRPRRRSGESSLPRRREAVWWMSISLLVKMTALLALADAPVWPVFDEAGYVATGLAARDVLEQVLAGAVPDPADVDGLYGDGRRPPLFPALLGLAFWLSGNLAGGRVVSLLSAAATSGLLYLWAGRMLGRRVGHLTAALHVVSLELLALSHLFWSESVFLLLFVAALERGWVAWEGGRRRDAILTGLALGLAAATRAAALPLVLVGPLLLRLGRGGAAGAAWCVAMALLVLAPWLAWLRAEEGRWVPLSTTGGYNLLLGQVQDSRDREVRRELVADVRARAKARGESFDRAAARMAIDRMRSDPATSLMLAAKRIGRAFAPTGHGVRHVIRVAYPPMPPTLAVALVWSSAAIGFGVWLGAAYALLFGRLDRPVRTVLVVLGGALLLPLLPTVSSARLGLPIFVIFLPAAAAGWLGTRPSVRTSLAVAVVACTAFWSVAPKADPCSSWYRSVAGLIGCKAGLDRAVVRAAAGCSRPTVEAAADARVTLLETRSGPNGGTDLLVEIATAPPAPSTLRIRCDDARAADIAVIEPGTWRSFEHGAEGLRVLWLGGYLSPSPYERNWPAMPAVEGLPVDTGPGARRSRAPHSGAEPD